MFSDVAISILDFLSHQDHSLLFAESIILIEFWQDAFTRGNQVHADDPLLFDVVQTVG